VVLILATKENGLEVNADKTKYMFMSRDQSAGRSDSMEIDNLKLTIRSKSSGTCTGASMTSRRVTKLEIK
jgi:hypothetical protein